MKSPRCKNCRSKYLPLRWRGLLDGWFCLPCEYAHIQWCAEALAAEIESALRDADAG